MPEETVLLGFSTCRCSIFLARAVEFISLRALRLSRFTSILSTAAHVIPAHQLNSQTQQPQFWLRYAAQAAKAVPALTKTKAVAEDLFCD